MEFTHEVKFKGDHIGYLQINGRVVVDEFFFTHKLDLKGKKLSLVDDFMRENGYTMTNLRITYLIDKLEKQDFKTISTKYRELIRTLQKIKHLV